MKKFLTITLALALTLGLTACSKPGSNDAPPLYFSGHITKIDDSGAFDADLYDLEELDGDTAFLLYKLGDYGLAREDLKECVGNTAFQFHMKDILEYRTMEYYRRRYVQM